MSVYVLVHGAWAGAHGFRKVRPLLWRYGHEVFTPALTGVGERFHLTGPQVTLATHVQDVVNLIRFEDLDDIVLMGLSYGGMVVCGSLAHLATRVRHVVFVDAFVPQDGQSLLDLSRRGPAGAAEIDVQWQVPPTDRPLDDPAEQAWSDVRRTPQPIGTFVEPVRMPIPLEEQPFSRTYVKATADPSEPAGSPFWQAADRARTSSAWSYHEIATHHLVPLSRPHELADILLAL